MPSKLHPAAALCCHPHILKVAVVGVRWINLSITTDLWNGPHGWMRGVLDQKVLEHWPCVGVKAGLSSGNRWPPGVLGAVHIDDRGLVAALSTSNVGVMG